MTTANCMAGWDESCMPPALSASGTRFRETPGRNIPLVLTMALGLAVAGPARAEQTGLDLLDEEESPAGQDSQANDPDPTEDFEALKRAAELGVRGAQALLGLEYELGEVMPQNLPEAFRWYKSAAAKGSAVAQWKLGDFYLRGEVVPQNFTLAARWLKRAAQQGISPAQRKLSLIHSLGWGVPMSYEEAYFWANISVVLGDSAATEVRDQAALRLSPTALRRVQERCQRWMSDYKRKQARLDRKLRAEREAAKKAAEKAEAARKKLKGAEWLDGASADPFDK